MAKKNILCISDTQFPFCHKDTYAFLDAVSDKYNIDTVVHQGDEVDFHCYGRWTTSPEAYGPAKELELAVECMHNLYMMFPKAMVCTSNHTVRPLKKAFEAGLPKAFLRDYHEFLEAPNGWKWADKWELDGILFEHGENVSGPNAALNAAKQNMKSTSIGHQHCYGGVKYYSSYNQTIFGLNTGCLIDTDAYAFAYGRKARVKPTLGCGVILQGVPHFIPMQLKQNGRWNGKL